MKNATIRSVAILVFGAVLCLLYMQFGRNMTVYSNFRFSNASDYSESMDIVLNRLVIVDEEECAYEIMQKYLENDFGNIFLRGDVESLSELRVKVYLSERDVKNGNCALQFCWRKKQVFKDTENAKDLSAYELEME